MNQAIDAAQIDECAEVVNLANGPFAHLPRLQLRQQRFLRFFLLALQHGPPAENQVAAPLVRFGHDADQLLPDVIGRVLDAVQRNLADRNEAANAADLAFEAAGVRAGDAGFDHRAFGDVRPVAGDDRAARHRHLIEVVLACCSR